MNIAENIKKARLDCGLSKYALAHKIGVSPIYVGRWENLGVIPSDKMKKRLAEALGVSVSFLFYEENEKKSKEVENG